MTAVRVRLPQSTIRSVCITAFRQAISGRPIGARLNHDRTL
jgi:hypothetical protein